MGHDALLPPWATESELDAITLASKELVQDTTRGGFRNGDGSTAGGILTPTAAEIGGQAFVTGTVGGTADAITLTMKRMPTLAAGAVVGIRAASTNTGATTLQLIDLHGTGSAVAVKKNGGSDALEGGEIVAGGVSYFWHNGTAWQLVNEPVVNGVWSAESVTAYSAANNITFPLAGGYDSYEITLDHLLPDAYEDELRLQLYSGGAWLATTDYSSGVNPQIIGGAGNNVNPLAGVGGVTGRVELRGCKSGTWTSIRWWTEYVAIGGAVQTITGGDFAVDTGVVTQGRIFWADSGIDYAGGNILVRGRNA